MGTSAAFERFRYSFFEDPDSARQGLDTTALAQLEGEERAGAEDLLIRFLPDTRAVIGLGVLRSRRAEPQLVELFEEARQTQDTSLTYLARALWLIRPDPRWPAAAIEVLTSAEEPFQRMHAALALYEVRDSATVRALIRALDDPKGLVRHHAARGLLAIHDLPTESNDPAHMIYRVMSDDAARHDGGKRDILAAIAARPHPTGRPPGPE